MKSLSVKLMALTCALVALLSAGAMAQAPAPAAVDDPGLAVVKASDCFTCHRVGQKLIGPAYKDVAAKYKGADDAKVTDLAKKIVAGGSGVWGAVPMRAHPTMSEEDAKKAVKWVLSLADAAAPGIGSAAPAGSGSAVAPVTN